MSRLTIPLRLAALPLLVLCTSLLSACGAVSEAPDQALVSPPAGDSPSTPVVGTAPADEPPCVAI